MSSIKVELSDGSVIKSAIDEKGLERIRDELQMLEKLQDTGHVPKLISQTKKSVIMERIEGESLRDKLGASEVYEFTPLPWPKAQLLLRSYATAEMALLEANVLYRDLNLEHVIFTGKKAVLVDLEAAIVGSQDGLFYQNDFRGTWETMAPEEFPPIARLSSRTATYRVAVVAHLLLAGRLPFERVPSSRAHSHAMRKSRPAVVGRSLPKPVAKVLSAALSRQPERRHKDPERFFASLLLAYENPPSS